MVLGLLRTEANTEQEERSADQCEVERLGQLGLASNASSSDLGLFQAFVEWGPSTRRHSRGWIIPGEDRGKIEGRLDLRDGGSRPMTKVSPRGRHEDEVTTTSSQVTPRSDNRRNKVAVVKAWRLTGAEGGGGTCLSVDDLLHIRKSGGLGQELIQDKHRLEAEWGVKVQRDCDLNPVVPGVLPCFAIFFRVFLCLLAATGLWTNNCSPCRSNRCIFDGNSDAHLRNGSL